MSISDFSPVIQISIQISILFLFQYSLHVGFSAHYLLLDWIFNSLLSQHELQIFVKIDEKAILIIPARCVWNLMKTTNNIGTFKHILLYIILIVRCFGQILNKYNQTQIVLFRNKYLLGMHI